MKTTKDQPAKSGEQSIKTTGTAAKKQTAEPKKGVKKEW